MNQIADIKHMDAVCCRGATILTMRHLTPVGLMLLGVMENRLCLCDFAECQRHESVRSALQRVTGANFVEEETSIGRMAADELDRYFSGTLRRFSTPLALCCTDFRFRVFEALASVEYGSTVSYSELACMAGSPSAVRVAANAVAANPLAVFLPCHRVVPAAGGVGGFRGGVAAKKNLLEHEKSCSHEQKQSRKRSIFVSIKP